MAHEQYNSCLEACMKCAAVCEHCATACAADKDIAMMAACIRLDRDCSNICWTTAAFMSRGSKHYRLVCHACAEVCEACAAECSKHNAGHCQRCADACRRCAQECHAIAAS